ncbi:MAG TPA: AAA family ATPase [Candidatus Acidoferrum sp.]|nr:AAA family ATPase [Candidatus Acidoferrum sp.]
MKVFREFRLDGINHCLWRAEERVPLTPKAFDVLRYLVEHSGRLVSQEEILESLWPDSYVNPEIVKKYVLRIRKVLGDEADKPIFVATFPRRGYQFIAPVQDERFPASSRTVQQATKTIVGRENALAQLDNFLDNAVQGERQIVFITGEAGIGKTTLADLFQQTATSRRKLRIARGQCVEGFGGKEPYYALLEAIGQLLRDPDENPFVQALMNRAPTWLIQFPSLVKPEQREVLQREILGATRERMLREMCEVLEVLTAENPLVFILEDLHWVDGATLDVISALARRRESAKLVLVGTYRPADVLISQSPLKALKQDLLVHNLCHEIALERLEKSDVAEFLASQFPQAEFPAGLANLIYRHSGGNALFMTEIVQQMVKSRLIAEVHGSWTLTRPLDKFDPGIPETLQQLIEVQFEQLDNSEQNILKSACVAGDSFSVWALVTSINPESNRIEAICEGLAEKQQFIKAAGIQELASGEFSAHYEFRHSLYREVLYRRLSDVARSNLHRALGDRSKVLCTPDRLEIAGELAAHFEEGHAYEQAVHYLILAAETSARRFAYREAIQTLQHALKLVAKAPAHTRAQHEIEILETIGDAYYCLGAMAESAKTHEAQANRAAGAGLKAAEVSALNALVRPFGFIDPTRGLLAVERAVQVSAEAGDPLLHARCEMLAACTRLIYDTWRKEDAEACASASQKVRKSGGFPTIGYPEMLYGYVQSLQGNYREALKIADAGIPKLDRAADSMVHFFSLGGKTLALLHSGQFGELMQIIREGKAAAEKNGNSAWLFIFREAWLRILVLDYEGARQLGESVGDGEAGHLRGQPKTIAKVAKGYLEIERGNYEQAVVCFEDVLDPELTPRFFLHWYWRLQAQLGIANAWLAAGNLHSSQTGAELFSEFALSTSDPNLHALAWDLQARIAVAQRNQKLAEESLEKGLAILEQFEVPVSAWRVHATAYDLYRHKTKKLAEMHRARAEAYMRNLADSFAPDEPLRNSFVSAQSIRRVLNPAGTHASSNARKRSLTSG